MQNAESTDEDWQEACGNDKDSKEVLLRKKQKLERILKVHSAL